jgi:uncharacterized alkaline shock family protein YloU
MEGLKMAENKQIDTLEYGNVNISDDVIGIISSIAAAEIEGVNGLSGKLTEDLVEMFGKKNFSKGVKVEIVEEKVVIDLNIIVDYGVKIPDVSWQVQENVKTAIESMTGLSVSEVNVHVNGINIRRKDKSDKDTAHE